MFAIVPHATKVLSLAHEQEGYCTCLVCVCVCVPVVTTLAAALLVSTLKMR